MRKGEIGTLIKVEPQCYDKSTPSGFIWPEYWIVQTTDGSLVHGHAHRFTVI